MFHFMVVNCIFLMACVYTTSVQHCDCPNSSQIEFNITGRRNQTGHWNAQMLLGMEAENKSIGPWAMNVGHKSTNCGQTETLLLNITLSVAPPTNETLYTAVAPPTNETLYTAVAPPTNETLYTAVAPPTNETLYTAVAPPTNETLYTAVAPPTNETQDTEVPYVHVPGLGYYKIFGDETNNWKKWTQAKEVCEQDEAHLLVLNSKEEAAAVGEIITNVGLEGHYIFIGITDQFPGGLRTIFNQTLPEAGYAEFSHVIYMSSGSDHCGLWNGLHHLISTSCYNTAPFICEREE